MAQNSTESYPGRPGIKYRLPRIGCVTLFILVFFYVCISLVFLKRTAFPPRIDCKTPDGHITVYDPCHVLRDDDRAALTTLANEVADAGGCDVALLFVDEQYASFERLFDAVLRSWATPKGVLLMYGLQETRLKMGLRGGEWRLAGHDEDSLRKSLSRHIYESRAGSAKILLDDLKRSIEKANRSDQPGTVKDDFSGVYYDFLEYSDDYGRTSAVISLIAGLALFLFALFLLLGCRESYRKKLAAAPEIQAEFERRRVREPQLRLEDKNAPTKPAFPLLHHPVLQILAIALGVFLAWNVMNVPPSFLPDEGSIEDVYNQPDIPDHAPEYLLDLSDVFSTDEEAMLKQTIGQLELNAGGQVRILTVKKLDGIPLESFTLEVASKWKLGEAGKDNGALLFLAVKDRKNRIEVGYGWEAVLTDARCGDLLRDAVPELRDERYADACAKIVRGMERYLVGGSASDAGPARSVSSITVAPQIKLPEASHDPRERDTTAAVLCLLGAFFSILGILAFCFVFMIDTSAPDYVIVDPTKPKSSGKSSSDRSSSRRSSSSGSGSGGSRSSPGGGGSFGGGGASGGW